MNIKNKKIVVTGGSGFFGSRIVNILQEKEAEEIIVPRSSTCDLRKFENYIDR